MTITKDTFQFLKDVKKNNDREWFNAHKERYVAANENFIGFTQSLIHEIAKFDKSVAGLDAKKAVYRIYRDTRFSKDKTPYKTYFSASLMGKNTGCGVAGYYLHVQPGNCMLAGGVHMPEPKVIKEIRHEISFYNKEFMKIINAKNFKDNFTLQGEKLVKIPQGFDKDDPMAEYLKYKELMICHSVADKNILADNSITYCTKVFKAMLPFNSFINKPLIEG